MRWIRLFNDKVSVLVNFSTVLLVTETHVWFSDDEGTILRISGDDQAKIQETLNSPTNIVSELKCEGTLALN